MSDTSLTKEQKKELLHQQVLQICKEKNLTELEVYRMLQTNAQIRKEQKPKN